jgi:hypothetical protein
MAEAALYSVRVERISTVENLALSYGMAETPTT